MGGAARSRPERVECEARRVMAEQSRKESALKQQSSSENILFSTHYEPELTPKEPCRVFVGTKQHKSFPEWVTNRHFHNHLASFSSDILNVTVARGARDSRFGIVTFTSRAVAEKAIQEFNSSMLLEQFCLHLSFFVEKKTSLPVMPSVAFKNPSQQVKPIQGSAPYTEAKGTATLSASIPLKSNVPIICNKTQMDASRTKSRRGRRRESRSVSASSAPDEVSSPNDHICNSPVETPLLPLVVSVPSILESSSQISLSSAHSPTLEIASSEPLSPRCSSPAILIKYLSLLVTEEEIKALLLRYGFEMVSCKVYTSTEASGSDSGMRTVLVHLDKCCNVSEVVTKLDGLRILGECICVVPFQASGFSNTTTHTPAMQANLISTAQVGLGSKLATQKDSSSKADDQVHVSKALAMQEKCNSSSSISVVLPSTTPVMLKAKQAVCMSEYQYNFFMKRFPENVKQLQERGGNVRYHKGQMIAQAPTKDVLDKFINDVGKTGEVKQYLNPDQWKSVQTASSDGDSHFTVLKTVLGSDLSAEVHPSLNEPQVLLVVGITEELEEAGNRLYNFFSKDLPFVCLNIEALQMKALFCILPYLAGYIFQQYRVKIDGFNAQSTYLSLRGPPTMISQARADIIAKVSSVLLKQVEFPHPHILIRSVQKRITKSHAFLLPPDEEESTSTAVLKVHICSLVRDSLEDACQVIKDGPFEKQVMLVSNSPIVTTVCTKLQKQVAVVIKVQESSQSSTSLLIQGYVIEDVKFASKRLDEELNPIKRSLCLSIHHRAYLKTLLDSTPLQGEGETLYHSLCDLAVRVEFNNEAEVYLIGVGRCIESAVDQILRVLNRLHYREFPYTCDPCFLEQIEQKVLKPIQTEKEAVFYCVDKTPKHKAAAGSTPVTFSISIFCKNSDSFKETCEAMKAICPYSSSHSIHPDALTLKGESLNDVASKHSAKIELVSEPKPLLRIHALYERNAVSCWAEINKFIALTFETTEEVRVDVYKARYIQIKHAEEIAEFGQQCDIQLPQLSHKANAATLLSILIKGNIGIVSKACKRIKEVSELCKVEEVTLQCPFKCLSMWRKRWEEFQDKQEEQYDIMIETNCQPPPCRRRGSDQPQPDASATFVIYGHDHEGIEATVQLLLEKENGKLLAECVLELSERNQIILLTGLKNKQLNPRTKYSICMDIDKETRVVKLTAPVSWKSRLLDAKEEILQFIGDQTQVKYEFICNDHVVGLILTSRSFEFCSHVQKIARDSNISIQPFRKPRPGFKLWGLEASIEQFKSKAKDLVSSRVMPMIGSNQLQVSALEVTALSSKEFHHLKSRLQEELCVVCQYPNKGVGEDEACSLSDESELSDQEDTSPLVEGEGKHWFWVDENGQFIPYPSEVSDALTSIHIQCSTGSYNWVCLENGNQYCIDLTRMEQRNTVTGVARKVSLQPAKHHWYYLDDHGVDQSYDGVLSNQLEKSFSQGKDYYIGGIYSFDLKLMVMIKPIERPVMREIKAIPAHVPQHQNEKKLKHKVDTKRASVIIRGPKKNLQQAQSQIRRELGKTVITQDLDLPSQSTTDFEQHLKTIADSRRGASISIVTKHHVAASSSQAKMVRIKGLRQSVDTMVIKIQDEIIKFQSLKTIESPDTPPEWETQDQTVQLFQVQYNSSEWCQVTSLFKETLPAATVLSVKRIQNTWLWKKYVHHRAMLHQKNAGKVNEKTLFHGTRDTDPEKIFDSEEGFDMRFSSDGLWGQANYFAVNSSYSNVFAHVKYNGEKEILLAKVLTGISVQCESDRALRMPPLMSTGSGGIGLQQQRYDTVCGFTQGYVVYMTYSNDKAYPAYLIRYKDNIDDYHYHRSYYGAQPARQYAHPSGSSHQHTGTAQPPSYYGTQPASQYAHPSGSLHQHTGTAQPPSYYGTQPGSQYVYSSGSLHQHTGTPQPFTSSSHTPSVTYSAHYIRPTPPSQPSQATGTQSRSSQATGAQSRSSQATGTQSRSSLATGALSQSQSSQATGAQSRSSLATGAQSQSSQATGAQSRSSQAVSGQSRQPQGTRGPQRSSSRAQTNNCIIQ